MHPYAALTPEVVLDALSALGLRPDGRLLALNSYENRVYQVWLRGRAARSSSSSTARSAGATRRSSRSTRSRRARRARDPGAPLVDGRTLTRLDGFRFAVFRAAAGARRSSSDRGARMDRPLHRAHPRGWRAAALRRPRPRSTSRASATSRARSCSHAASSPPTCSTPGSRHRAGARSGAARASRAPGDVATLRLHGDCHGGNVLWTDAGRTSSTSTMPASGPAVQDLWMLVSGDRAAMGAQLGKILAATSTSPSSTPRARPGRGAAHAAPAALLGVDRAALGRPRVPRRVPVVQHPALLAGPDARAARADRADAGRAAGGRLTARQ